MDSAAAVRSFMAGMNGPSRGRLRQHCSIKVGDTPTGPGEQRRHALQQQQAGNILVLRVGRGKCAPLSPRSAAPSRASSMGVNQHVAVAMPGQPPVMGYLHPAQHQPTAGGQRVGVKADADAKVGGGLRQGNLASRGSRRTAAVRRRVRLSLPPPCAARSTPPTWRCSRLALRRGPPGAVVLSGGSSHLLVK